MIAYPFAGFFYVSRSNPLLADAIRVGFERAIEDGSYQQLVDRMIFTPWLREQLKLENRSVVVVLNPAAATALMDVDPRHWIVLGATCSMVGFSAAQIFVKPRL